MESIMNTKYNFNSDTTTLILLTAIVLLLLVVALQTIGLHKYKEEKISKFFLQVRIDREQSESRALNNLKAIIDDGNVPAETKKLAAEKYMDITLAAKYQFTIESILKSKGFEDVLSFIDNDRVKVIVKSKRKLSNNKVAVIKEVVFEVTRIRNVDIDRK